MKKWCEPYEKWVAKKDGKRETLKRAIGYMLRVYVDTYTHISGMLNSSKWKALSLKRYPLKWDFMIVYIM